MVEADRNRCCEGPADEDTTCESCSPERDDKRAFNGGGGFVSVVLLRLLWGRMPTVVSLSFLPEFRRPKSEGRPSSGARSTSSSFSKFATRAAMPAGNAISSLPLYCCPSAVPVIPGVNTAGRDEPDSG